MNYHLCDSVKNKRLNMKGIIKLVFMAEQMYWISLQLHLIKLQLSVYAYKEPHAV